MSNVDFVSVAKPKVGGAVYRAPLGSTIPTDATTELDAKYVSLGYISEDGMTNANEIETDEEKAWGGDTVNILQTGYSDTFEMKFIESLNVDVLKMVFGDENVTGTIETGITVKANSKEKVAACYVVDMVMKGGVLNRIVIPNGLISETGEAVYTDGESVGFEVTLSALPDASGNTHYNYIAKKTTV